MSLDSNPSQNEDIAFLNASNNGTSKSPVRKRASHQSPTKGINMSNNNNNNENNKPMDHDNDSPTPNWNWKINSQHNDDESESQPLQLNRKNKLQNSANRESPQATQEDKSADEAKSRNHSNNNSQNIDMTLELARERLQSDDKEGSQENMELRRQKLLLLKQLEDEESVQQNNIQNEHYDDATIDPNATIDVDAEPPKRKEPEITTNEEQSNDNTMNKKPKLMIDLLEEKPDVMIEEDINATLPFAGSPKKEVPNKKEEEEAKDENTQPMEEVSLQRKKRGLKNSTEVLKQDESFNNNNNDNVQNKPQQKSEENSQNTQPMETNASLGRLKKSKTEKDKKEDDGSDTEPLADEKVPRLKKSNEKIGSSLEAMLGPCSIREVKQDELKKSDFVDWETEKAHFEKEEADKKLVEKIQTEHGTNNNHMTDQERLDFELAQKLQHELDQQGQQKVEEKPKEEPKEVEVCLSENEKVMFEYFKKKKEQEEIDRKMAEDLAKQLEEEDKKIQQQRNNTNNNADAQNKLNESPRKDPVKMDNNVNNNADNINNNARGNNENNSNNNTKKHVVEIEYPNYWQKQVTDQQLFTLDPNSNEFQSIAERFLGTVSGEQQEYAAENFSSPYYISKIQRNQNRRLWMWYLLRKQEVEEISKVANEQFLFHGSAEENYEAILKEGLDLRLANAEGSIGAGIYFAPVSGTSLGYISDVGRNRMLLCRVTLGIKGEGEYGLKRPPDGFDSVCSGEEELVVFDSHQAYPEYIISFNRTQY